MRQLVLKTTLIAALAFLGLARSPALANDKKTAEAAALEFVRDYTEAARVHHMLQIMPNETAAQIELIETLNKKLSALRTKIDAASVIFDKYRNRWYLSPKGPSLSLFLLPVLQSFYVFQNYLPGSEARSNSVQFLVLVGAVSGGLTWSFAEEWRKNSHFHNILRTSPIPLGSPNKIEMHDIALLTQSFPVKGKESALDDCEILTHQLIRYREGLTKRLLAIAQNQGNPHHAEVINDMLSLAPMQPRWMQSRLIPKRLKSLLCRKTAKRLGNDMKYLIRIDQTLGLPSAEEERSDRMDSPLREQRPTALYFDFTDVLSMQTLGSLMPSLELEELDTLNAERVRHGLTPIHLQIASHLTKDAEPTRKAQLVPHTLVITITPKDHLGELTPVESLKVLFNVRGNQTSDPLRAGTWIEPTVLALNQYIRRLAANCEYLLTPPARPQIQASAEQ